MPLVYYIPEYEKDVSQMSLTAERLLRLLGLSGKLTVFPMMTQSAAPD